MSFWRDVEGVFAKLFGSKAAWEETASQVLTVIGPLVSTVVTLVGGAGAGLAVQSVIGQIKNDLVSAIVILQSNPGGTAKAQAQALISSLNANLQSLLEDADVKNSKAITQITAAVTLVSGELQGILAAV